MNQVYPNTPISFPLPAFAVRLSSTRIAKKMTQSQLAEASGLEPAAISHFECGRREPSLGNLVKLVDALKCDAGFLIGTKPSDTSLRERVRQLEQKDCDAEQFVKEMLLRCARAMNCMGMIDKLREPEGDSVILFCDNPDWNGLPNSRIEVAGDWTGYEDRRFTGDSLEGALNAALRARDTAAKPVGGKSAGSPGGDPELRE